MPTAISKIFVNAFYYPVQDQPAVMNGYIKTTLNNKIKTEYRRKWAPHPYCPVFFVPFVMKSQDYFLKSDEACTAHDVTPTYQTIAKIKWEMKPLNLPGREQQRLDLVMAKLDLHLQEIVEQAKPLKGRKQVQRRRFVGQFPHPLREGIDEKVMYGTIGTKDTSIEYTIYEPELSTSLPENKDADTQSLRRPLLSPERFFYHE
ncbi:MAG: hypothetical protein Q7K45_02995 [Nanoarchaeota archaeon]|nr:hypothetical protein [Nanoarchaeota archaeon]